jgi:hypothetical protein
MTTSIPIDILLEILKNVCKADLATLCRGNKIFCSCSQNVLYREIRRRDKRVIPTIPGRPTSHDGFARLKLNNHPQSWQLPCETCRHFAVWTSMLRMMPPFWMGALSS